MFTIQYDFIVIMCNVIYYADYIRKDENNPIRISRAFCCICDSQIHSTIDNETQLQSSNNAHNKFKNTWLFKNTSSSIGAINCNANDKDQQWNFINTCCQENNVPFVSVLSRK